MKLHWGNGIIFSFILFCGFIVYLVIRSFQQEFHLTSENYYQQELAFQNQIKARQNTSNLKVLPAFSSEGGTITLSMNAVPSFGEILFYRPDNANLDKSYKISEIKTIIPKSELTAGRYIAKLSWREDNVDYYFEKEVVIVK